MNNIKRDNKSIQSKMKFKFQILLLTVSLNRLLVVLVHRTVPA